MACPLCCTALGSPRKRPPPFPNLTGCFSRSLFPYRIMSFSYVPKKSLRSETMEIMPASIVRKEHAAATKFEKRGIAQKRNVRIAKLLHRENGTMIFHFFFLSKKILHFAIPSTDSRGRQNAGIFPFFCLKIQEAAAVSAKHGLSATVSCGFTLKFRNDSVAELLQNFKRKRSRHDHQGSGRTGCSIFDGNI